MNKSLITLAGISFAAVGTVHAATIFSANSSNYTLITNGGTPAGLATHPDGGYVFTGDNPNFNNAGFASTQNINTALGRSLTDSDTVTIKLDVREITGGAIRSQGVYFGMSGDTTTLFGGDSPLLVQMEASNTGNDVVIGANSFQDAGATGLKVTNAEILNGFVATLTADKDGYEFSLTDVHTDSPHIISGTFSGSEFVDNFGTGHFYYTVQKYTQGTPLNTVFNEASIDVTSNVPEPSSFALLALSSLGLLRRRRA